MQTQLGVIETYRRAVGQAERVIGGIGPEQLSAPTPCAKFDVHELLNHFVGSSVMMATVGSGRSAGEGTGGTEAVAAMGELVGDDPSAAYARANSDAVAAFSAPGALERTWKLPFGEMPGAMALNIHLMETVLHTYDLARATGQTEALDPDLAEAAIVIGRQIMSPAVRNDEGNPFAHEIVVPDDAPAYDRLAGLSGRRP